MALLTEENKRNIYIYIYIYTYIHIKEKCIMYFSLCFVIIVSVLSINN
jgi:hypothetical protein